MHRSASIFSAFLLGVLLIATTLAAADRGQTARHALGLAELAADTWVEDARLVWIENNAPLDSQGRSKAWAFLFYSEALGAMRSWAVQEGKLQAPEDHSVRAEAPGLEPGWLDSTEIMEAVRKHAGSEDASTSQLVSLVLARGVFDAQPTWVAVFDRGAGPRLHLVLRAANGDLIRRWRG
jgi:hypothetical protein